MEKKTAGLLGAIAGMATMGSAQAAINPASAATPMQASSYAELLTPIPNAVAILQASNAESGQAAAHVELAQYYGNGGYAHHHHHHHHQVYRRPHHHHHHHGTTVILPGIGGIHTH